MSEEERQADIRRWMQSRVDNYNATPGKLKDGYTANTIQGDNTPIAGDGYDCPLCMNRGDTLVLEEVNGYLHEYAVPCKCMGIRRSIWRMRASGLAKVIRQYTFDRFDTTQPWQRTMLDTAKAYLANGIPDGYWFFAGGQVGCGKTHICTAIARELLYQMPLIYMPWENDSKRLKAIVNDAEEYGKAMKELKEIPVLYIDDLFKPVPDDHGGRKPPSGADVKLAFEILNFRYNNQLPTIISSEWTMDELIGFDEATASRISERCDIYQLMIGPDRAKNHRLLGGTTL